MVSKKTDSFRKKTILHLKLFLFHKLFIHHHPSQLLREYSKKSIPFCTTFSGIVGQGSVFSFRERRHDSYSPRHGVKFKVSIGYQLVCIHLAVFILMIHTVGIIHFLTWHSCHCVISLFVVRCSFTLRG